MNDKIHRLKGIDWEFPDYSGFSSFPANINSLHWYPAPFVPQIPTMLIQSLTKNDDIILDPFAGSGVTLIEAAKLRRKFIGVDLNPYAINIINAKFNALDLMSDEWLSSIIAEINSIDIVKSVEHYLINANLDDEISRWFDQRTLEELCSLHRYVCSEKNNKYYLIKKVIFSSILNRCSSQREHYTYVTDSCFPKKLVYINAIDQYLNQAKLVNQSAKIFRRQYELTHGKTWSSSCGLVSIGDARDINFLKDGTVDCVLTSPPYLGVNDYTRSMRLTWLFFPETRVKEAIENEIGSRRKRFRKNAYHDYINDMEKSFSEISRILKPSGYLCLILGQGKGKVSKGNVVNTLLDILEMQYGFKIQMRESRKIKFRRIQVPGIGSEEIVVLNRSEV